MLEKILHYLFLDIILILDMLNALGWKASIGEGETLKIYCIGCTVYFQCPPLALMMISTLHVSSTCFPTLFVALVQIYALDHCDIAVQAE